MNYDWKVQPQHCPGCFEVKRYTAHEICEIMKGRSVMIVGDSMSTDFTVLFENRMFEGATEKCGSTCSVGNMKISSCMISEMIGYPKLEFKFIT